MIYRNQRQFAAAIGISPTAVSKLLRRADCIVGRRAPWGNDDLDLMKRWRATLQEDRSACYRDGCVDQFAGISLEEIKVFCARLCEQLTDYVPPELIDGS